MPLIPDFQNTTTFPPFSSCPDNPAIEQETPLSNPLQTYYLLGTIAENMTLSTNPTFVCKDRDAKSFAVMIKVDGAAAAGGTFDVKGCRKGYTMAVRGARKYGVVDGKQGYVNTVPGSVQIIPASLEKLMAMSSEGTSTLKTSSKDWESCQACGTERKVDELSRCKGCEAVWYCNKECQTRGWNEKGHKAECKVLKALGSTSFGEKAGFVE